MNSSKSSTSVMFAAAGNGTILPPYVVYKAQHLYQSWTEGGPPNARYNRTKSGWFDSYCFEVWVEQLAIPYLRRLDGRKFLIGDNLSSHLSLESIKLCAENNIRFIFLPSNSTHITQPLDVAFFRPTKRKWREILEEWKKGPGRNEATVPKDKFPSLLNKLYQSLKAENVLAGFKKCGISPLCRQPVLMMLPSHHDHDLKESTNAEESAKAIDASLLKLLKNLRQDEVSNKRKKRTKLNTPPGKSVGVKDYLGMPEVAKVDDTLTMDLGLPNSSPKLSRKHRNPKSKQVHGESSSSECSDLFSLQDSDQELVLSSSEDEQEYNVNQNSPDTAVTPGDYAVIKVYGKTKNSFRLYACKICNVVEDGYVCVFLKKQAQTDKFVLTDEESFVSQQDIVRKLSTTSRGTTLRFKDVIIFKDDVRDLMY